MMANSRTDGTVRAAPWPRQAPDTDVSASRTCRGGARYREPPGLAPSAPAAGRRGQRRLAASGTFFAQHLGQTFQMLTRWRALISLVRRASVQLRRSASEQPHHHFQRRLRFHGTWSRRSAPLGRLDAATGQIRCPQAHDHAAVAENDKRLFNKCSDRNNNSVCVFAGLAN